jgi:hypothetical protein
MVSPRLGVESLTDLVMIRSGAAFRVSGVRVDPDQNA